MNCTGKINEIGSEFWFDPNDVIESDGAMPAWLAAKFPVAPRNFFFTSSGRSACMLLLQHITPTNRSVLLPGYTCESVIAPFIHAGYSVYYYDVEPDLRVATDQWLLRYRDTRPGVVLFHAYFGFNTIADIWERYDDIRADGTVVIEDTTHSLLSRFPVHTHPDYYVASIRKWLGVPDGGVLIDCSGKTPIAPPERYDDFYINTRTEAFALKQRFMRGDSTVNKGDYLPLFAKAESHLEHSFDPKAMSEISRHIVEGTDWDFLVQQRRANYLFLERQLERFDRLLSPIFNVLPEQACPLFMPVRVKTDRQALRAWLVDHHIYTPVHWPVPKLVADAGTTPIHGMYHQGLSLPCDQRYAQEDMLRVAAVLDEYERIHG